MTISRWILLRMTNALDKVVEKIKTHILCSMTSFRTSCLYEIIIVYYFLWLCSPARAMASCGTAAQRMLWPPVALQPSAGYDLLWLCSPVRVTASCVSAAQHRLWPPVALQPSAGYGLLWLCSPAQAMDSCGSAAQRGVWPPVALQPGAGYGLLVHEVSWSHTTVRQVGLFWTSDQLVAETYTWQHTQKTNIHAPDGIRIRDRSRRAAVDLRLRSRGHWDRRRLWDNVEKYSRASQATIDNTAHALCMLDN
jgi:hypothetical protein